MTAYGVTGVAATPDGPRNHHAGPFASEAEADAALQALRDRGTIHRLHSTIYAYDEQEEASA